MYLHLLNNLKDINAEDTQIILQTTISNGQWTQTITLDIFIKIAGIKKKYQIFLYQARNNAVKNAILTQAWSEGNDASGIWLKSNLPTHSKTVSGLSRWTKLWIVKLIIIAITAE